METRSGSAAEDLVSQPDSTPESHSSVAEPCALDGESSVPAEDTSAAQAQAVDNTSSNSADPSPQSLASSTDSAEVDSESPSDATIDSTEVASESPNDALTKTLGAPDSVTNSPEEKKHNHVPAPEIKIHDTALQTAPADSISPDSEQKPIVLLESKELKPLTDLKDFFDIKAIQKFLDNENTSEENKQKVLKALRNIADVIRTLDERKKFTPYALINWADFYLDTQGLRTLPNDEDKSEEIFTSFTRRLNSVSRKADSWMTWVYLGLNFFGLLVALSKEPSLAITSFLEDETANAVASSSWNYFDGLGGIALAIRQIMEGETEMGVANLLSSAQVITCTLLANLSSYTNYLSFSATTASNLMGFSFAACMAVSCAIEYYEAYRCYERVAAYKAEIVSIDAEIVKIKTNQPDTESRQIEIKKLEEKREARKIDIMFEEAKAKNHLRSAASWMACAVAMTMIALGVSTLGLGFGAVVAVAACAFVTGLIRKWWVGRVDYVKEAKRNLVGESPQPEPTNYRVSATSSARAPATQTGRPEAKSESAPSKTPQSLFSRNHQQVVPAAPSSQNTPTVVAAATAH